MRAVVLAMFLLLTGPTAADDCVSYAHDGLRVLHLAIRSEPTYAFMDKASGPLGRYSRGKVDVRTHDCRVLLHEFIHHWQWEKWGDAKDANEWHAREMQADLLTRKAEQEMR